MRENHIMRAMELSMLAYRDVQPKTPGVALTVISHPGNDVQCFLRKSKGKLCIAFRGSDSAQDWHTNLAFGQQAVPYGNDASAIRVHSGFINAYKARGVRDVIHRAMDADICRVQVTGHSQGAALAILCAVDLEYNFPDRHYEVIVFGAPRVGNRAFRDSYNRRVPQTLRVENGNDIVTKLPFTALGYRHAGACCHIGPPRLCWVWSAGDHRPQAYYENLTRKFLS